jgi:ribonuclease P protein component
MISRNYRFHSRGGVRYTYSKGQSIRTPKLALIFNENSKGKQRFAVVVSKKVLKSAVGRNRIRRRIYETIRLELPNIKKPLDAIFVVYSKELKTMPYPELTAHIRDLLNRAEVL